MCVCVCVCVCVRVLRACMHVCVCVCVVRWRMQSDPGNKICPVSISAITHPTDQISTEATSREMEAEKEVKMRVKEEGKS